MKLAYLITAYKFPDQVVDLVSAIHSPHSYCAIHCDSKAEPDYQSAIERGLEARGIKGALFLPRQPVTWGGWSSCAVAMRGISALLHHAADWEYFVNLSGQCLPTRPQKELIRFLSGNRGRNFMECMHLETEWRTALYRLRRFYIEIRGKLRDTKIPRLLAPRFPVYGGSAWVMINRPFCEYVVSAPEVDTIKRYIRYTPIPDEQFFQTVIMNSPFRPSLNKNTHRYLRWPSVDSPNPAILTMADMPQLLEPGHFFARKFDRSIDADVIDKLLANCQGGA